MTESDHSTIDAPSASTTPGGGAARADEPDAEATRRIASGTPQVTGATAGPDAPPDRRPPAAARDAARTLKLVVTLRPEPAGGYQAVLAAGADGCDPLFRTVTAGDVPDALGHLGRLAADADLHWQATPRYPMAGRREVAQPPRAHHPTHTPATPGGMAPPDPPAEPTDTPPVTSDPAGRPDAEPARGPAPARAGQLSLFDQHVPWDQ